MLAPASSAAAKETALIPTGTSEMASYATCLPCLISITRYVYTTQTLERWVHFSHLAWMPANPKGSEIEEDVQQWWWLCACARVRARARAFLSSERELERHHFRGILDA